MHHRTAAWTAALLSVPLLAVAAPAGAAPPSGPGTQELATGLVSPLAMSVARDGTVYVSEQFAGRLTAVSPRGATRTVAEGPVSGVDATGRGTLTVTLSAPPEDETQEAVGAVARVDARGRLVTIGSTLDHEVATNPDAGQVYGFVDAGADCLADTELVGVGAPYPGIVESNPYAVLVHGGDRVVADAAGNSIVRVRPNGTVRTVAVLPPVEVEFTEEVRQGLLAQVPPGELPPDLFEPCVGLTIRAEPVPTDVELGPDGMYYVSSLPGFPEAPGTGGVYRVDPRTGSATRLHDGLTGAVDLAVDSSGAVYVAELFAGQVTRIAPDGSRTSVPVDSPGAVEVDRHGAVYVTTGVFAETGGSLLRWGAWPGA
ncbi:ScyD/ScyE family protein [Aquipuribacter sp. SD81]|uniref:ScyD/ScyE family protein n=1 Tax=Aquipuribacter sp. SD81 TaxID=3127703 RepID=UPI0030165B39